MDSRAPNKKRWWSVADRIGATASFLCAIHCAALPFVLALLPLLGLGFLADHRFERGFVMFACALALFTLISSYRHHRRTLPLMLAMPGLALLISGVSLAENYSVALHSVLVTCGGLLVASAHFINLRTHRAVHVHGPQCAH
ncbi:MerC domain-containing protein [Dyella solisilvae]|uniref:MerC domain-containing protein n=1 Tax=Dyella solisilvae TaxID=1920168 RepID=A0A370K6B9_9GAMM|nr:MerC domain-containing protein [Dyella solisilvae]RDI98201.1 MerC domain-containing protein [Dyella solisilvae]